MITDTYSIFWREMKRYKKSRGGFIIRLIQPAVWIIVMGNIFSGTQPLIESVGFDGVYRIHDTRNYNINGDFH